jgi:prepilin-type N-terminal cleavage/methylation domain-containing protein
MAPGRHGYSLLEVVVALAIVTVAILALAGSIYQSNLLQQSSGERMIAYNAARSLIEKMRSVPLSEVYARYNASPGDDPGGSGTAAGPFFDVQGLVAPGGGRVGCVRFPEAGSPATLREDVRDAAFAMPEGRDLNRDGQIDSASRAGDYAILPVRIELAWEGVRGRQKLEFNALLTEK